MLHAQISEVERASPKVHYRLPATHQHSGRPSDYPGGLLHTTVTVNYWHAGINCNSVVGTELSSFCLEHGYVLSEVHASLVYVNVCYDAHSSEHFRISMCLGVKSVHRLESECVRTQARLIWSKASTQHRSAYTYRWAELIGNIEFPRNAFCCCNTSCEDASHIENIRCLYYSLPSAASHIENIHCLYYSLPSAASHTENTRCLYYSLPSVAVILRTSVVLL